jgi:DNA invertase Pin-like site-specific DNA recombinase
MAAAYASARGYQVVQTFRDDRSGLDLKGRPGLRRLLAEALGPAPGFRAILVHDVSRWGRFQDLDQGAHYEFLCRKAGLVVEYCAEPFDNDGSPQANLIKQVKRSMAAEYSRQLSQRITAARRQLAAQGYFQTGTPPYGVRRMIVALDGTAVAVLEAGVIKAMGGGYRTRLIQGPPEEVETVRRIFRLFAVTGLSLPAIAARLSAEGRSAAPAKAWTSDSLRRLLRNEIYLGDYVYGRTVTRLKRPTVAAPPDSWIRASGVMAPMVSRALFDAAQAVLAGRRRRRTDAEMLQELKALLAAHGRLDTGLIDAAEHMLGACSYIARFGGLRRAYALIGYSRAGRRAGPPPPPRHAAAQP